MRALLEDRHRTAMIIVTLLEEMPVRETLELYATAKETLGMPMGPLIVNRVWPSDLTRESSAQWLAGDRPEGLGADITAQLDTLDTSLRRNAWEDDHLRTLRETLGVDPLLLPELPRGTFDQRSIGVLAQTIEAAIMPTAPTPAPSPAPRST